MDSSKRFTPVEFYKYITEPIPEKELQLWFKANDILFEKSELFFYFIKSLYLNIEKTHLGHDVIITQEEKTNHFDWCWKKTIESFEQEEIFFNEEGTHKEYFMDFFNESFYNEDKLPALNNPTNFFDSLFSLANKKTKSELDIFTEIYKTMDKNLN